MPSVTKKPKDLMKEGPILEVQFIISSELERKYREEGKVIPKPIVIKALVDTGCTSCAISDHIPKELNLQPVGSVDLRTPSGKRACFQYFMRMLIPSHGLAYEGTFIGVTLEGQDVDCLIGRDVLKDSILIYIGPENQFTLSIL